MATTTNAVKTSRRDLSWVLSKVKKQLVLYSPAMFFFFFLAWGSNWEYFVM